MYHFIEPVFRLPDVVFNHAIECNALSADTDAHNYVEHYVYIYSDFEYDYLIDKRTDLEVKVLYRPLGQKE